MGPVFPCKTANNLYPERYRLAAVTRHVLELLERRRPAFPQLDEAAEDKLRAEAQSALAVAGEQFREVADDPPYWRELERAIIEVALPRYFLLAREQSKLQASGYGLWRGGDLISRIAYGALGVLLAAIVWRLPLPKVLEPLPLLVFIFGPVVPDFQRGVARRRYRRDLVGLVGDMQEEAAQRERYRPLASGEPPKENT